MTVRSSGAGARLQRKTRPSWIGCSVSMRTRARASGSPAAAARSQKPFSNSSSVALANPAVVTQAPIAPFPHRSIASPDRRLTLTN